jgi:hypothetical protein
MATHAQILTANRLRDGEVVYWQQGAWVLELSAATRLADKAAADAALGLAGASVADRVVVSPYLFEIRENGRPVKEREIIRAEGPSVRRDLGKQARHVPV